MRHKLTLLVLAAVLVPPSLQAEKNQKMSFTSWTQLPQPVQSFRTSLLQMKKPSDLKSYFKFPVTAYDITYTESSEGVYQYYYQPTRVESVEDLQGFIEDLKDRWSDEQHDKDESEVFVTGEKLIAPCDVTWFGVANDEELAHYSVVGFKDGKIEAILMDANPEEVTSLKGFKSWNLGQCR